MLGSLRHLRDVAEIPGNTRGAMTTAVWRMEPPICSYSYFFVSKFFISSILTLVHARAQLTQGLQRTTSSMSQLAQNLFLSASLCLHHLRYVQCLHYSALNIKPLANASFVLRYSALHMNTRTCSHILAHTCTCCTYLCSIIVAQESFEFSFQAFRPVLHLVEYPLLEACSVYFFFSFLFLSFFLSLFLVDKDFEPVVIVVDVVVDGFFCLRMSKERFFTSTLYYFFFPAFCC